MANEIKTPAFQKACGRIFKTLRAGGAVSRDRWLAAMAAEFDTTVAVIAQKYSALKSAGVMLPPIPAGKRGKRTNPADAAAAQSALLADMLECGLIPATDDDGNVIPGEWVDAPVAEVESESAEV